MAVTIFSSRQIESPEFRERQISLFSIFAASVHAKEITATISDTTTTISDATVSATANNGSTTTNSALANGSTTGPLIAEYWYDHTGERIKKNESGVVTYYWTDTFEQKVYPNGTTVNTTYYFANGERLAKKVDTNSGSEMYYFHPDHLGSTSVVSNESGQLVEETGYYPYGGVKQGGSEQYLFTNKELDKSTGLYYYGARYYNPELMRFVEADPLVQDPHDPQNLNRYAYVRNNPLKYIDPTGKAYMKKLSKEDISNLVSQMKSDPLQCLQQQLDNPAMDLAPTGPAVQMGKFTTKTATKAPKYVKSAWNKVKSLIGSSKTTANKKYTWGRSDTLVDHFERHGGAFGAESADDYARKANIFYKRAQREGLPTKVDEEGVTRIYNPDTNSFAAYNSDRTTRTYFKPKQGQKYWDEQPGELQ